MLISNKTEKELLIDLIVASGNTRYNKDEVEFTYPRVIAATQAFNRDDPNTSIIANTAITMYPKDTTKFFNEVNFTYRRVSLADQWVIIYGDKDIKLDFSKLPSDEENRKTTFRQAIIERFHFNIDSLDFKVVKNQEDYTVTLTADEDSLIYIGSLDITISKLETRFKLSRLNNTTLSGFHYPAKKVQSQDPNQATNNSDQIPSRLVIPGFQVI